MSLSNLETTVDVTDMLKGISTEDKESIDRTMALYFEVLYEKPEIFYASNKVKLRYSHYPSNNQITSATLVITYSYDDDRILDMRNKLEDKVNYIIDNYLNN